MPVSIKACTQHDVTTSSATPRNPNKIDYRGWLPDAFEALRSPHRRSHAAPPWSPFTLIITLKSNQGRLHKEANDHFHFALRHLRLRTAKGWSPHQHLQMQHASRKTPTRQHREMPPRTSAQSGVLSPISSMTTPTLFNHFLKNASKHS